MAHHHLYQQRPNRSRVEIVATRENRHTLRDWQLRYEAGRLPEDRAKTFIRQCPFPDDECNACRRYRLGVDRLNGPGVERYPDRNREIMERTRAGETEGEIAGAMGIKISVVENVRARNRRRKEAI